MAFERFENSVKGRGVKAVEETGARNEPWGTIESNGSGFILHLGRAAVATYDLKPGDLVRLAFDPETHRIGVKKTDDGDHRLTAHGANPKRLKVSITAFYRAYLESYKLRLPFKTDVVKGDRRRRIDFVLTLPEPKRRAPRAARPAAPTAPEPEPAPAAKSRKASRPAPVKDEAVA